MCRPRVVCAYPITPQTHIVEALGAMVKKGELNAQFRNVESEFAAMSVAIGASAVGARAYTAAASQGLLYMSDAMSQRDAGWIQLYAETNQEAADLHVPSQDQVDAFLPPYEPRQVLDPDQPVSIGAMVGPEAFTEVRYLARERMEQALEVIPAVADSFQAAFRRSSGGLVRSYIVSSDIRMALAAGDGMPPRAPDVIISMVIAGLGGRAITRKSLRRMDRLGARPCRMSGSSSTRPAASRPGTGCLEVFSTPFPETSWQIAWLHSLFGNAPAVASGVAAALQAMGRTDIRVVGQGGDGGTVDIGMACLSGMFERNDDVLYICYDNQAYMNTGVQRSGATPPTARTATTPAVGPEPGNSFGQGKNVPLIAMAHEIPYVATATVADLRDLEYKATRAMDFRGARYLHILGHPAFPGNRTRVKCVVRGDIRRKRHT